MSRSPKDPWLLPLMSVIKTRPGMFLLGETNVRALYLYICGYLQARRELGIERFGNDEAWILKAFGKWLQSEAGSDKKMDWHGYIQEVDPSDTNIDTFFLLFEKFLASHDLELPDSSDAIGFWGGLF